MAKSTLSLTAYKDPATVALVSETDQKTLAVWAIECVERVMRFFEEAHPQDHRPRQAIETLQAWIDSGGFKMAVIRKASLDAHTAARETGMDDAARSTARAAGQAVATAHVPLHALGAANYALQAIYRATSPADADAAIARERDWQIQRLRYLSGHR